MLKFVTAQFSPRHSFKFLVSLIERIICTLFYSSGKTETDELKNRATQFN